MTKITRQDILHLAQLSSLNLSNDEIDRLEIDLNKIIDYVNLLDQLDTNQVEPTYQLTGLKNVWREDQVGQTIVSSDQLLSLAPNSLEHQVKVQKVL